MITSVLFDLDGVLVDACEWHYLSLNKALLDVVGYEISLDDHINKYNGLPTKTKLQMLQIKGKQFNEVWSLKQKYTIDVINEYAKKDDTKIELLEFLKKKNIKIACVTNSIKETATLMLNKTHQLSLIDLLISNEDVVNPKPSPEPYNKALCLLQTNPKYALAVEDSPKGIESASTSKVSMLWKVDGCCEVNLKCFMDCFCGVEL